jgi:glycosyltransferase involved in cell wall biosynthesis
VSGILSLSACLGPAEPVIRVLECWRGEGPEAAAAALPPPGRESDGLLLQELRLRLCGESGPRLLVDGLWFSRPHGGITRVWEQILRTWQLPGLLSALAPVALIERDSHLALTAAFPVLEGVPCDPLDPEAVAAAAPENATLARCWGAEVFLSSWISSCGGQRPTCAELALVHDCLPERYGVPEKLGQLRRRWLFGAGLHLALSGDTASDIEALLCRPVGTVPWCHSAPAELFVSIVADSAADRLWKELRQRAGLQPPYVLLPATSAIGSYKNPELIAQALADSRLQGLQLVLCGIAADQRRRELQERFSLLQGRCVAAGFTDVELALAYRHALAVVIPSHAEGFGLPAVEGMAAGATVLLADSRGLREAGGSAALRFDSRQPRQLANLLALLLQPDARRWLQPQLERRRLQRLATLQPDLLGVALLALARQLTHGAFEKSRR